MLEFLSNGIYSLSPFDLSINFFVKCIIAVYKQV